MGIDEAPEVEIYLARIGPRFSWLTPEQQAWDAKVAALKNQGLDAVLRLLEDDDEVHAMTDARDTLPGHFEELLETLEQLLPRSGYFHMHTRPTCADLAVLNMVKAEEFRWAYKVAGIADNFGKKYPKTQLLADLIASCPNVKEYLDTSQSFSRP